MEGAGILLYYYFAWVLCIIGIGIIIVALFYRKSKKGKVLLKVGFICLIPISFFMLLFAQQKIEMWNDLSPMQKAISKNQYNKVKQLIENGYDVSDKKNYD